MISWGISSVISSAGSSMVSSVISSAGSSMVSSAISSASFSCQMRLVCTVPSSAVSTTRYWKRSRAFRASNL